jgi:hypothetical protein
MFQLRESNALEGLTCTFVNLKDLLLCTDLCTLPNILSTLCLLKNAPNLEKIFFEVMLNSNRTLTFYLLCAQVSAKSVYHFYFIFFTYML